MSENPIQLQIGFDPLAIDEEVVFRVDLKGDLPSA